MNLVERAKNILLTPKTEWGVIEPETTPRKDLILGYVLPLALIPAIVTFISMSLIGVGLGFLGGHTTFGIGLGIGMAVWRLVAAVLGVFVIAFIIDALAPSFGGTKNMDQ